ncbi:MAG: GDSL-type esterase/lipase family protein [Saprospiraceae bacterium]
MKKWLIVSIVINIVLLFYIGISNIVTTSKYKEEVRNFQIDHYLMKNNLNEQMNKQEDVIVFIGDSQIEYCNWNELLQQKNILNRGIAGDITSGVLARIEEVVRHNPTKIFIQVGTNDLSMGIAEKQIIEDYKRVIEEIFENSEAEIFVNSILPVQDLPGEFYQNSEILSLNRALKQLCKEKQVRFIDLSNEFTDESDNLNQELTNDGLHLNAKGYSIWANVLKELVK